MIKACMVAMACFVASHTSVSAVLASVDATHRLQKVGTLQIKRREMPLPFMHSKSGSVDHFHEVLSCSGS